VLGRVLINTQNGVPLFAGPTPSLVQKNAHATVVVLSSPLIFAQRSQIADLALKNRLPTISLFNSIPAVRRAHRVWPKLP
jgi:hypothetical protein